MTPPLPLLSLPHQAVWPARPALKHPAIIALHGRGSYPGDLLRLAPELDPRLLWIAPQAPLPIEDGWEWYHLLGIGRPHQPTFDTALTVLERFLQTARREYPIDPQRLFLLGFSQGGMMAYAHTLLQPAGIAGVIAHSSYLPFAALPALDPALAKGRPFLIVHGTHDPVIPVQWAREARDYLAQTGADVVYHEAPIGHQVSAGTLAVVRQWVAAKLDQPM